MNDEKFLQERRQALRDSIAYFDSTNIAERDVWVCQEFLTNLGEPFQDAEVCRPTDDPPDVVFRDALFEVKELLDAGRRRHDEFKAALVRAEAATDPLELLTQYSPKDITPEEIGHFVEAKLIELELKYAPAFRVTLDLLLYVNLVEHLLNIGPMPPPEQFAGYGWRSVSAVMGWGGLVFHATEDGPMFLRSRVGTLTLRVFP